MHLLTRFRTRIGMSRFLAKLLFKQDFFGILFFQEYFDAGTLVMRRALLSSIRDGMRVCEIGTGSYAILLIMLAKRFKNLQLHGIDVNPVCAELAKVSVFLNGVSVSITESDFEAYFRDRPDEIRSFDLVLCNMPYIPHDMVQSCNLFHMGLYEKLHEGSFHLAFLDKLVSTLRHSGYHGKVLLSTNQVYLKKECVDHALGEVGFRSVREFFYPVPVLRNLKVALYAPVAH